MQKVYTGLVRPLWISAIVSTNWPGLSLVAKVSKIKFIVHMRKTFKLVIRFVVLSQFVPLLAFAAFHESLQEKRTAAKQEVEQKRQDFKSEVQKRKDELKHGVNEVKQGLQERKDSVRMEIKGKKDELKTQGTKMTEDAKKEFEAKRAELRMEVEKRKDEFKKNREAVREEITERRKQFADEAKARKEELKKKLGEEKAQKIEAHFGKMVEKFQVATSRLKQFADRIELRLNRAAGNGKDITDVSAKLMTAREKIAEAERAFEDAKAKYTEAARDISFKASFEKVRKLVHGVSQELKEAHQALVEVVVGLKGIGNGENVTPTSTPTLTPLNQ